MKVIENGIIRYIAYEFLFVFHCNYGHILYRFRHKARYWSKIANFHIPIVFNLHDPLEPLVIFTQNFNTVSPEVVLDSKKYSNTCRRCCFRGGHAQSCALLTYTHMYTRRISNDVCGTLLLGRCLGKPPSCCRKQT